MKTRLQPASLIVVFAMAFPPGPMLGQSPQKAHAKKPPEYTFKVIHTFPHDSTAFTQGLVYRDGFLYEGTGLNGKSSLRKVELNTGKVLRRVDLEPQFFGEGITIFKNQIVQLTWKSETGFVYNLSDFRPLRQFSYPGEGWGITTDGTDLFMSDGTAEIRVLRGNTLRKKRPIRVHSAATPITQLNHLPL